MNFSSGRRNPNVENEENEERTKKINEKLVFYFTMNFLCEVQETNSIKGNYIIFII